jgi:hypothetical protein
MGISLARWVAEEMALHVRYFDIGGFVEGRYHVHGQCRATKDNRQIHWLVAELSQSHDFAKWDEWISQKYLDRCLDDEREEPDLLADAEVRKGDDEEMSAGNKADLNSDIAAE